MHKIQHCHGYYVIDMAVSMVPCEWIERLSDLCIDRGQLLMAKNGQLSTPTDEVRLRWYIANYATLDV